MKHDSLSFNVIVEDILNKIHDSKIIISSVISIGNIKDFSEKIVEIKELKPIDSLELLKSKSAHGIQQDELIEMMDVADMKNFRSEGASQNILDHPFFKMINGHPLALVMVSSLRKEMRLKQIFELLMLIQEENDNDKESNVKNIAINLSMEANLIFLRGVNAMAYQSLIFFALLPAGLVNSDCYKLFGNQWDEYKPILMSKSLIFQRFNSMENQEFVSYRMDSCLQKLILKRAKNDEVSNCASQIIYFINSKLTQIYKTTEIDFKELNDLLLCMEGNIWDAIKRLKKDMTKNKKKAEVNDSETSWEESNLSLSEEEKDEVGEMLDNLDNKKENMARLSTYRARKENALQKLNEIRETSMKVKSKTNF
jgi:hypothetical protein